MENGAIFLVLDAVVWKVKQSKRIVAHLEKKDVTGKVEYLEKSSNVFPILGAVRTTLEKFESGVFTLKTHQFFFRPYNEGEIWKRQN